MAMFSTYIALTLVNAGLPFWVAFALTVLISFAMGFLIERLVIRPIEGAPELAIVIVFIGLQVIFNSVAGWVFGYTIQPFPSPFPDKLSFGGGIVTGHDIGCLAVTLGVVAVLYAFLRFTRLGLAMRCAALNPDSSRLSGIPVGLMLAGGWGLAAAIGAVAGILVAPVVFVEPNMMAGILLYGFAGALLGGLDNPWGALVGGLVVGVLENVVGVYLVGTELKLTVALAIIIGVLLVRPSGLFGTARVSRV
jgi:branched-chain amino acid transport system permease protein